MKRLRVFLCCALLTMCLSAPALADGTTELTMVIPESDYTLTIPTDVSCDWKRNYADVGCLRVTDGFGFSAGDTVSVDVSYTPFTCPETETVISVTELRAALADASGAAGEEYVSLTGGGGVLSFTAQEDGSFCACDPASGSTGTQFRIGVRICEEEKLAAAAGTYSAQITFVSRSGA